MLRCLFCDAELSDTLLRAGCCPMCGGRLMWPDDEAGQDASATPSTVPPAEPSPGGTAATLPNLPVSPLSPAPPVEPPVLPPRSVASSEEAPPPSKPDGGPHSHSAADQLPPELLARMTSAWSGAFDSGNFPRNTIKVSSLDTADVPPLVIRPRQLGGRGRPFSDAPDYELLEVIGEGGVGVVYAARQSSIDRMVAVKMLKPGSDEADAPQEKFLAEAVVTGELEHPNIVPIYDLGSSSDGTLFYSMKRVQGTPWDRAMARKSLPENLEILMKVCDAVAFAHSRGVVHRDLKPENVMLGGFGEVLVMDWGIALSSETDGRGRNIRQSATMGGTPAYMAPEMATGPLDRIGVPSDVYLLGGILYEIVTGLAPHTGRTVMDCLYSAAANEIQPSDSGGELVEIALQAMATDPAARYQSVQQFQDAIRSYQSHAESIVLSTRAEEDLAGAVEDQTYERFARALFAFEEALALWPGNAAAEKGVTEARRAYAEAALKKHDYELGLSLIDAKNRRHEQVAVRLSAGQREQQNRTQRIRMLRRVAFWLVIAMLTGGALALVEINEKRATAETEQKKAEDARGKLQDSIDRNTSLLTEKVSLLSDVAKERDRATLALKEEASSREAAQLARKREQRETYLAQIGLAAERIDANAFDQAVELLENYRYSPLAHWEWGRLWYMCRPHQRMLDAGDTVQQVQFIGDGSRSLVISRDGRVRIWSNDALGAADAVPLAEFNVERRVDVCAVSPDARVLAVASPESFEIQVYQLEVAPEGFPLGIRAADPGPALSGHSAAVTSLQFSADGGQLLSGSLDHTARLWDVETGGPLLEFQGHSWSVWQAAFSPVPEDRVMATAGQDGRVIVWSTADGAQITDFNEHQGPVYAVAFSADGTTVASAGEDRRILVWDWRSVPPLNLQQLIADGSRPPVPFQELKGHRSAVHCLQFSPVNRSQLLSGAGDNSLMVWDTAADPAQGQLIVPLRGHSRRITSCAISPDGLQVLSGSEDRKWGLWDIAGFQEVNQLRSTSLRGHENGILAAHFAPNGRQIITGSLDRTARLWDAVRGRELATLQEGHEYLATSAVALPDGRRILTSAGDNTARLWDLSTGAQVGVLNGTGRHAAMAVSSDGRYALTGASEPEVIDESGSTATRLYARLWDLETLTEIRRFSETMDAQRAEQSPMSAVSAVAISPDGQLFFTGHADGQGRLWRSADAAPDLLQGHTRSITAAAFVAAGGGRLLTASGDQTVAQWDVASGRELVDLVLPHNGWVTSLSVTDDGRTAITASEDGLVRIWDIDTAREHTRLNGSGDIVDGLLFADEGRSLLWAGDDGVVRISDPAGVRDEQTLDTAAGDWIYAISRSPDGDTLAIATGSGSVDLVDVGAGTVLRRFDNLAARDVSFTSDGGSLVCAGADGRIHVVDIAEMAAERAWPAHDGSVRQVDVAPDGRIVSVGGDSVIRVWEAGTGQELHALSGHDGSVGAVAFSRSGEYIGSGGSDGSVCWWGSNGQLIEKFDGHPGGVRAVAFSPDGRQLASGGFDRIIRIWQRGSTAPVAELEAHEGAIRSLAYSPDGRTLASLAGDRAVRLWTTSDWKWQGEVPKGRGMSTHPIGAISPDGATLVVGNSGERLFEVFRIQTENAGHPDKIGQFRADVGSVWSAVFTRDGANLITVGGDAARMWALGSGRDALTMRPHNVVSAVAWYPDGTHVVTGSWDHSARIWDAVTGRVVRQLTGGHLGYVTQAACLPDGRHVMTTGDDGAIRIWDIESGTMTEPSLQESGAGAGIISLSLSRDGRLAATLSVDDVVRIWDLSQRTLLESITAAQLGAGAEPLLCCAMDVQGEMLAVGTPAHAIVYVRGERQPRQVLSGHTAAVVAVGFSPDGQRLISGSEDFTAKVWDVESGKEMLSLGRHTAAVTAVEFSRDGRAVLTASRDGVAIVWPADAIAPSVQTSRDRFDYRSADGIVPLDALAELNVPTSESLSALSIQVRITSSAHEAGEIGNLCIAAQENSSLQVNGNDVAQVSAGGSTVPVASLSWSDGARSLDVTFTPSATPATANALLRLLAFQTQGDVGEGAEAHIETVTLAVVEADGMGAPASAAPAIEVHVLPPADTNAGSVLEEVESVLNSLKSSEAEQ